MSIRLNLRLAQSKYGEAPFRFMQGTTNVPGFYTAMPGLKIIREAGVGASEKSKKMTSRLIELADQRGWRVNAPRDPEQRGGTVAIDMPNAKEVCGRNCCCGTCWWTIVRAPACVFTAFLQHNGRD